MSSSATAAAKAGRPSANGAPGPGADAETTAGAGRRPKKRMLIIVNPYATTVSDRLKNLVVYALQGRYDVEAVLTEAQNHATEISREAVDDLVERPVAAEGDDDVVAAVARLTADLDRVSASLGVDRGHVVAALQRVDDEVLEPVGDGGRVWVDDHQHPRLRRARASARSTGRTGRLGRRLRRDAHRGC